MTTMQISITDNPVNVRDMVAAQIALRDAATEVGGSLRVQQSPEHPWARRVFVADLPRGGEMKMERVAQATGYSVQKTVVGGMPVLALGQH